MSREKSVVEDPVLVLEALQERILPEGLFARLQLVVSSITLLIERVYPEGQTTGQPERLTFIEGERGALVPAGAGEDGLAAKSDAVGDLRVRDVGHGGRDESTIVRPGPAPPRRS